MIHPNVGFKDVILDPLPSGGFRLLDPNSRQRACAFVFTNRKAARNWANGRGYRLIDSTSPAPADSAGSQ